MKLVLAIVFMLASVLTVQAQQGTTKRTKPAQSYATAASNASYANVARASTRSLGHDINNPWDGPRMCY